MAALFGVQLHELTLEDVEAFLASAGGEPLTWEAKADDPKDRLRRETVRREICAFANSETGGHLIIGARRNADRWELPGLVKDPPSDLPTWVSQIADGVDPRPVIDVRDWPASDERGPVGVVWIPPVVEPPAITSDGLIFHRVAGASRSVTDGRLLSELYRRGTAARELASSLAISELEQIGFGAETFGIFVFAATGGPRGYPSPLFTSAVVHEMELAASETFSGAARRRPWRVDTTNRWVEVVVQTIGSIPEIALRATRVGTVSVRFVAAAGTFGHAAAVITGQEWPQVGWHAAMRVHGALGSSGSLFVMAAVNPYFGQPGYSSRPEPCVRLWTAIGPPTAADLAIVDREIRRTGGEPLLDDDPA